MLDKLFGQYKRIDAMNIILVMILRDEVGGRRAGYLEAALRRRRRIVGLYSTLSLESYFLQVRPPP